MKIALVTDDGKTVSAHFGHARYLSMITMENGEVISTELIERSLGGENKHHEHGQGCGGSGGFRTKFLPLQGCDLLVARGMGTSAMSNAQSLGVEVILTDLKTIDDVLSALADESLAHNPRRVHQAHH